MKKIHIGVKNIETKEDYVTFSYIINEWCCLLNREILFIKYEEHNFQLGNFATICSETQKILYFNKQFEGWGN